MKKLFYAVIFAGVVFVLIPLLGNKVVSDDLDNRIEMLSSYGVEVSKNDTDSTYFTTKKHYEFLLKDTKKFLKYLEQFSDNQLPPYTDAILLGVLVGADVEYSNFGFNDEISVDIYPLSLSDELMQDMQKENPDFAKYIKAFLQSKGILYHINYSVVSSDFDGYIKDVKESYTFKTGSEVILNIAGATFKGSGPLIAPTVLSTSIKHIDFSAGIDNEIFLVRFDNFTTTSNFDSQTTYATTMKLKNLKWSIDGTKNSDAVLEMNNIDIDFSSNTQGQKAEFYTKSSFDKLKIKNDISSFEADNFNYDLALRGVDKKALEELRVLISHAKVQNMQGYDIQQQINKKSMELVLKGLRVDVADLSLEKFTLNDNKDIKGFKVKADVEVKESGAFSFENMSLNSTITLSKEMMSIIYEESQASRILQQYAKEDAQNIVFVVKFINSKFSINSKAIN